MTVEFFELAALVLPLYLVQAALYYKLGKYDSRVAAIELCITTRKKFRQ